MRTNDSIQNILMNNKKLTNNTDKYTQSGVYRLSCPDCKKAYVGQTERNFLTRFNEHKVAFRTNNQNSNYAKHLTEHTHSFGPIQDTMQILERQNKGAYLNTIERYYNYTEFTKDNHLNDEHPISPNKIFEALLIPDQTVNPPPPPIEAVTPPKHGPSADPTTHT